jgi:hypothetical protein
MGDPTNPYDPSYQYGPSDPSDPGYSDSVNTLIRAQFAGGGVQTQMDFNAASPATGNQIGRNLSDSIFNPNVPSTEIQIATAKDRTINQLARMGYTGIDPMKVTGTTPQDIAISALQQAQGQKAMLGAQDLQRQQQLKSLMPLIQLKNSQMDRQNQWAIGQGTQQLAGQRYQADSDRVINKYQIDSQKQLALQNSADNILGRASDVTANLVAANRLR